ncbi:MAG: hypothetical protein ABJA37_07330 [Ferruginibacter sp.]
MKYFSFLICSLFFSGYSIYAQNVGVGTTNPQQALDVNGGVKIGTASTNISGTLRYNSGKFEGGDGTSWKSFDNIPAGTIVLSAVYPNAQLQAEGFSFLSKLKGELNTPSTQAAIANSWQPASAGISGRYGAQSVWTGTKVILWGGYNSGILLNDGALYDPVNDSWQNISSAAVPSPRDNDVIIWTGTEMIVWGGYIYNAGFTYFNDGAKYNPATNTWTPMNTSGALTARGGCAYAWTGTELVIWGGSNGTGALTDGAKYNPGTNTWAPINSTGNPGQRYGFGHSYNSTDLYVWGGFFGAPLITTGYKYNFVSNAWALLPVTGTPPSGKNGPIVKWAGNKLIVWGGKSSDGNTSFNTGSTYDPATSSWTAMINSTATSGGKYGVIFNNKLYIWGLGGGQFYDVAGNTWNNYPSSGFIRTDRNSPAVSVTNFGFLSWGGQQYGAIGAYLPYFEDGERFFVDANPAITINSVGAQLFYLYIKN